uniref:Uncharacterized protein n=1 Tax=Arundo donax TaxID=35708 RepID=A0A0A9BIN0_ARUDO
MKEESSLATRASSPSVSTTDGWYVLLVPHRNLSTISTEQ